MSHKSSRKTILIAGLGIPSDYRTSLVPLIIQNLGYKIQWVSPIRADLLIYGSFYDVNAPRLRWLPIAWRKRAGIFIDAMEKELSKRKIPPLTLFHTAENLRHDHIQANYAISHDLNVPSERHFRLPYWMEVIDWSHEGIIGNSNPRYGELLRLERLQTPLGGQFLKRAQKAVLITSHLRQPRASCYEALKRVMPVDGIGPYFNKDIKDHHKSNFLKKDILEQYAFNLCPENGAYPGYVTEKIPESFAAGCVPLAFVDEEVVNDFNPKAFINLKAIDDIEKKLESNSLSSDRLREISNQPLILKKPSLEAFHKFISIIVAIN